MKDFNTLPLKQEILENLGKLNFTQMTPIQQSTLPLSLNGQDVIAKAKTGSGKTVAFSLAILNKLQVKKFRIQSLILCPTRELANQVAQELRMLAKAFHNVKIITLCGGMPHKPQVHSLSHHAHIVVGTPGRVLKHLQQENFSCEDIETFVLDEADRMLEMGFIEDIEAIKQFVPNTVQTLLFSATFPQETIDLANKITNNAQKIFLEQDVQNNIKELHYKVHENDKSEVIIDVIKANEAKSTIIFCNTKLSCEQLADELEQLNVDVLVLHSDYEQQDRMETLILFSSKTYPVLIATDVAARGLDIEKVDLVINYDLPLNEEIYTHRIGRTGRMNKQGIAVSLSDELDASEYVFCNKEFEIDADFRSIYLNIGKRLKISPADILGALCVQIGLDKSEVGKIDILPTCSYVAIKKEKIDAVYKALQNIRIKGKYFKSYLK